MFARPLVAPGRESFFLLGPRGTGKSTWVGTVMSDALTLDLLDYATYAELLQHPERLEPIVVASKKRDVVIDEVQRLPALLDGVHRLIEKKRWRFTLTGSSARKLRRGGVNLLAGRARTLAMHPLTAVELGSEFDLRRSLVTGHLPTAYLAGDASSYLRAYVGTSSARGSPGGGARAQPRRILPVPLRSELLAGEPLSVAGVARELGMSRKTVEGYFDLLVDLPLAVRRAKRAMTAHENFYYFDVGVRGGSDPEPARTPS